MPVITNIADLKKLHERRTPRMFYDYAESGSWTEQTFRANTSDFADILLRQRIAVDMSNRSTASQMIGEDVSMPVALAPVGLTGMQRADGEIKAARAAEKFGVPFIRSQRINTCVPRSKINKAYRYAHHLYLNAQVKSIPGYYDPDIQNCGDFDHNLNRLEGMFNKTKGIIEIMLHPAGDDDPETNFFSSPEVEHLLSRHSIVNYNHLR